jgi:drug/metabolite transporter (DMT)-like permease
MESRDDRSQDRTSRPPDRARATAAVALQTLIAASTFVVAKHALTDFRPLELAGLRMIGAALLMAAVTRVRYRGRAPATRPRLSQLIILGAIGVALNQVCFLTGLSRSTPTHAALLYALTPAFVHVLAVATGDEPASLRRGGGILVALVGAAIVIAPRGGLSAAGTLPGDLLILVAVIAWAIYSVRARGPVRQLGAVRFTSISLTAGAIASLPIVTPALLRLEPATIPIGAWLGLGFLIAFTSGLAYALWTWALRGLEATQVAIFANAQPVITALLSFLLLAEPLTLTLAGGGLLVLIGVGWTQIGENAAELRAARRGSPSAAGNAPLPSTQNSSGDNHTG